MHSYKTAKLPMKKKEKNKHINNQVFKYLMDGLMDISLVSMDTYKHSRLLNYRAVKRARALAKRGLILLMLMCCYWPIVDTCLILPIKTALTTIWMPITNTRTDGCDMLYLLQNTKEWRGTREREREREVVDVKCDTRQLETDTRRSMCTFALLPNETAD